MNYFYLLLTTLFLNSCGNIPTSISSTQYAILPENQVYLGIPGMLEINKVKIATNFSPIAICVGEGQSSDYSNDQFFLEVKLAYAMWLKAANSYSEKDWNTLHFFQGYCNDSDDSFASYVRMSPESMGSGRNEVQTGLGGPSSMRTTSNSKGWAMIKIVEPASADLNSGIHWFSLLKTLKAKYITGFMKFKLINLYEELLDQNNQSYGKIMHFVDKLQEASIVKKETSLKNMTAFTTLVHEVGHQFGLNHADNPSFDSRQGMNVNDIFYGRNSHYVTDHSIMAYADDYLYLTQDDRNGVETLVNAVRKYIERNK